MILPASIKELIKHKKYWLVWFLSFFLIFILSLSIPSLDVIKFTIRFESFGVWEKIRLTLLTIFSNLTIFKSLDLFLLIVLSMLVGLNITLVFLYLKLKINIYKTSSIGILGILISLLGIGCSACGSVLLTALLGASASGFVLSVLPFRGAEFMLLGIMVVLVSIIYLDKKFLKINVCKIKK